MVEELRDGLHRSGRRVCDGRLRLRLRRHCRNRTPRRCHVVLACFAAPVFGLSRPAPPLMSTFAALHNPPSCRICLIQNVSQSAQPL